MSTMSAGSAGISVTTLSTAATDAAERAAAKLKADGIPAALVAKEPGLWGPRAAEEAAKRLGWLDAPRLSVSLLDELAELGSQARSDGLDHIVLAGMGGSALAAEVITRSLSPAPSAGPPAGPSPGSDGSDESAAVARLTVLDTTDPHEVARVLADRLERTLVVVSSKSGSTIETDSLRRIYEGAFASLSLSPEEIARRFVVVTDPGSPSEVLARDAGYPVVQADPAVGGRFSALTAFGLVPSVLAGANVAGLLDEAAAILPILAENNEDNPGLVLGAVLGGYALAGHDKAVIGGSGPGITGFGDWAEQLIAESTGKQGRGILPVVVPDEDAPGFSPGPDLHLIGLGRSGPRAEHPVDTVVDGPLGSQFLLWEYAVALAGRLLGVNPFDQPSVQESKDNTKELLAQLAGGPAGGSAGGAAGHLLPAGEPAFVDGEVEVHADAEALRGASDLAGALDAAIWSLPTGGYLAVMAFLDRIQDADAARLRATLAARTTHPVTFGWGPRYLHSTGQYHKGGPQNGVYLQITGAISEDVQVPGTTYSLGRLQLAQALGDLGALRKRGRPAIRLHLRDRAAGVAQLISAGGGA